jgi:hypothetical protein
MAHILIEFRTAPTESWQTLGTYVASDAEVQELKALMDGREDLREVLEELPPGLVKDSCEIILVEQHWEARVSFPTTD